MTYFGFSARLHPHPLLFSPAVFPWANILWARSCTWRSAAGHCRAPIDCSIFSSLPLLWSAATSLPPPTHSSPMNTLGTFVWQVDDRETGIRSICSHGFSAVSIDYVTFRHRIALVYHQRSAITPRFPPPSHLAQGRRGQRPHTILTILSF